jgi:hypothetical protein
VKLTKLKTESDTFSFRTSFFGVLLTLCRPAFSHQSV